MKEKIIEEIIKWQKLKEDSIPNSSYYYYCYGIEMGLKIALQKIQK